MMNETTQTTLPNDRVHLISLPISLESYSEIQDKLIKAASRHQSQMVCFANVHMLVEARRSPSVAQSIRKSDWILADGVPLTWGIKSLYKLRQDRIAGMDLTPSLLARAAAEGVSVFFYGSTPHVLERVQQTCAERFPTLKIAGMLSPPFRPPTPAEDEVIIKQIGDSGAGLVFIALGCPKQELWMARMREYLPAVLLGVGNALAILVGDENRAPIWIQRAGMEWLFRLVQEPRRLFKRYAITNSLYIYYFINQFFSQRFTNDISQ